MKPSKKESEVSLISHLWKPQETKSTPKKDKNKFGTSKNRSRPHLGLRSSHDGTLWVFIQVYVHKMGTKVYPKDKIIFHKFKT